MKKIIIIGSSRNDGDTKKLVSKLMFHSKWESINLNDYVFSYFDYSHKNKDDDFIPLMKKITTEYTTIIFATPVYWYSMSGIMKVFFDRITDLLTIEKEIGRKFKNISMAVISCSEGDNLGDSFWLPFKKTAEYLEMDYITDLHTYSNKINSQEIKCFIDTIEKRK